MSTAPSGATVARARYWLTATIKAASLVVMAWNAAGLVVFLVGLAISMALEGWVGQMIQYFWSDCGLRVVCVTLGFVAFMNSRRISAMVFPITGAHCPACGYSRRGLVSTDPCPECGARFNSDAPAATAQQRARRAGEGS